MSPRAEKTRPHFVSMVLLGLCLGVLVCPAVQAQDPYRSLRASLTTGSTLESDNELLEILELVAELAKGHRERFEILKVAPASTRGGGALLVLPDADLANQELVAWLIPQVVHRISEPLSRPSPCRDVDCCQRMADLTCIRSYPVESSLFGGFDLLLVAFDSVAMELAVKSEILDSRALRAERLKGDTAWWVWPVQPSPEQYLLTEIDIELVDRLVVSSSVLKGVVAGACPGSLRDTGGTACSPGGFDSRGCSGTPVTTITVSTGRASGARSLSPLGSTVEVVTRDRCLDLRWRDVIGNHRGIRDWQRQARTFLDHGGGACLGTETKEALEIEQRSLNQPDAGILFFYSLYLLGVWEEIAASSLNPFTCSG